MTRDSQSERKVTDAALTWFREHRSFRLLKAGCVTCQLVERHSAGEYQFLETTIT